MVPADVLTPVVQVGREIRIECSMVFGASWAGQLAQHLRQERAPDAAHRPDDLGIIDRRKADAFLRSVHVGAVRR